MKAEEFTELQYGMFIHFGLYSKMARGEWAMNRERIAPTEMEKFARTFQPDHFDADELCQLAVDGGMRYLVFTTMHHDGFFIMARERWMPAPAAWVPCGMNSCWLLRPAGICP